MKELSIDQLGTDTSPKNIEIMNGILKGLQKEYVYH